MARSGPGPAATRGNLFDVGARPDESERFDALFRSARPGGVLVERIVGSGKVAPATYAQAQDEWVVLLRGAAELEVEGEGEPWVLGPGDWVSLPAGTIHTVVRSSADAIWLAVHAGLPPGEIPGVSAPR